MSTPSPRPARSTPPARSARDPDGGVPHRTRTGAVGEQLACDLLTHLGLEVVARNWRISAGELRGELDVVALDHDTRTVVMIEVKTRRGGGFGGPLAAVTPRKQAKIRRLAVAFLMAADLPYHQVRFDVVAVRLDHDPPHLDHIVEAF